MRSFLLLSSLIIASVGAAMRIDTRPLAPPKPTPSWVRTTQGWERPQHLRPSEPHAPRLHPFTVAGLQLLGSLLVLAAFDRRLLVDSSE